VDEHGVDAVLLGLAAERDLRLQLRHRAVVAHTALLPAVRQAPMDAHSPWRRAWEKRCEGAAVSPPPRDRQECLSSTETRRQTSLRYSGVQPSWFAKRRMQRICFRSPR